MRGLWNRWVRFFDERETGEVLALIRIGTGIALLLNVATAMSSGVLEAAWLDNAFGGYRDLGKGGGWLFDNIGGATATNVWATANVSLVASVALILGFGGRITAFVLVQGILALSMANPHARGSYDALHSNILWLLCLAPHTETWSVDRWLKSRSWTSDRLIPSWPRRLILFQLVAVYFFTALHKVSADWLPGGGFGAVYYVLQMPGWHRIDMRWLAHVFFLTQVGTFITWTFELTSPALLIAGLRQRKRKPRFDIRWLYVPIGIGMHISILLTMEVGPFSIATLALYPALFTPEEMKAGFQRLRKASRLTTSPPVEGSLSSSGGGPESSTSAGADTSNSSPNVASGS